MSWVVTNAKNLRIFLNADGLIDLIYKFAISNYIITQVILAFWLVPAYDLLENKRTNDVIITKFFPQPF